jgi:hypothetical protein
MKDLPPIALAFTAAADIEPTDSGFAIIQDGRRVELSDLLAERFVINVLGAQRRANRASA